MVTFNLKGAKKEDLERELNGLKRQVDEFQTTANNEKKVIADLTESKKAAEAKVVKLNETIAGLENLIADKREHVKAKEEKFDKTVASLSEKQTDLNSLKKDTKIVQRELVELKKAQKRESDNLQKLISKKDAAKLEFDSALAVMEVEKKALEVKLEEEKAKIDRAKSDLAEIGLSIKSQELLLIDLEGQSKSASEKLEQIIEKITYNNDLIKEQADTLDSIVAEHKVAMTNGRTQLATLESRKLHVEKDLIAMEEQVADHKKAFINLSKREENMRAFCAENGIDTSNF